MTDADTDRITKLAEALRKEAGHEDKEFPEQDDYCPHAGGDFSRSCAAALDALMADRQRLRDALARVSIYASGEGQRIARKALSGEVHD